MDAPRFVRRSAVRAAWLRFHLDETGTRGEVYVEGGYVLGLERDPERARLPDVSYVSEETLRARGCGPLPLPATPPS